MPKQKKTKTVKRKIWWLRKGEEGFLTSNLWTNRDNARFTAKGLNWQKTGSHTSKNKLYKVIPITITYKV